MIVLSSSRKAFCVGDSYLQYLLILVSRVYFFLGAAFLAAFFLGDAFFGEAFFETLALGVFAFLGPVAFLGLLDFFATAGIVVS